MAKTVQLDSKTFKDTVDRQGTVFIDWWAPWCGPCRAFAPTYEKAAEKHADITFAKVNTEEHPDLSGVFGIQAIPTLMIFRDGILLFNQAGALPGAALENLIEQVRKLDMDEIRKDIESKKQAENRPQARLSRGGGARACRRRAAAASRPAPPR